MSPMHMIFTSFKEFYIGYEVTQMDVQDSLETAMMDMEVTPDIVETIRYFSSLWDSN